MEFHTFVFIMSISLVIKLVKAELANKSRHKTLGIYKRQNYYDMNINSVRRKWIKNIKVI